MRWFSGKSTSSWNCSARRSAVSTASVQNRVVLNRVLIRDVLNQVLISDVLDQVD